MEGSKSKLRSGSRKIPHPQGQWRHGHTEPPQASAMAWGGDTLLTHLFSPLHGPGWAKLVANGHVGPGLRTTRRYVVPWPMGHGGLISSKQGEVIETFFLKIILQNPADPLAWKGLLYDFQSKIIENGIQTSTSKCPW